MNTIRNHNFLLCDQSLDVEVDSFYCFKWGKISKWRCALHLNQTKSYVELIEAISIHMYITICLSLKLIEHYFLSYGVHRQMIGRHAY